MSIRSLRNAIREQFGLKVFTAFFIVIVVLLTAYTAISAFREWSRAEGRLREQGEMLADLLSQNVVVGLFAEDKKLLQAAAAGILGLKDVTSITIYNSAQKELYAGLRTSSGRGVTRSPDEPVRDLRGVLGLEVVERADSFQFIQPVSIRSVPEAAETLYFDLEGTGRRGRVIGYAQVVMSKDSFRKDIAALVTRNSVMMLLFIAAGWVIISFAVKQVTPAAPEPDREGAGAGIGIARRTGCRGNGGRDREARSGLQCHGRGARQGGKIHAGERGAGASPDRHRFA